MGKALRLFVAAYTVAAGGCRLAIAEDGEKRGGSPAKVDPGSSVPDEIHWTITGIDSVAFDWRGGGSSISFHRDAETATTVDAASPEPTPTSSPGPFREARLTALKRDSIYHYRISGEPAGEEHAFRTPPVDCAEEMTFVAEGDIGASRRTKNAAAVQTAVASARPRLVLALGDLAYAGRDQTLTDVHFNDVMVWSRDAAYMPVWGNHEWQYKPADDLRNYKGRFALPHDQAVKDAPVEGCCREDWSWFDYGCVRLISYPEPYTSDTWSEWAASVEPVFKSAEDDPAIRYVVTFGHRPAYSSGGHSPPKRLRRILDGFGERFDKYVLNLAGHNHGYERIRPRKGVVHITAGTGGSAFERADTACGWPACSPPRWSRYRALRHGILVLTVSATHLAGRFLCGPDAPGADVRCSPGDVLDEFTIAR